jgi:hypothetical protein
MSAFNTFLSVAPSIISILKMRGIDVDIEFIKTLEIIPKFIEEKQKEYLNKYPDLDINLMASYHNGEIYLIPVGLEVINLDDTKHTIISKQFEPINISEFLRDIKVTELIKVLKNNPDISILEAIGKSRLK